MRWLLAFTIIFASAPLRAYQATSAGPASFIQPFSSAPQPAETVKKENPAQRVLLDKIDAEIARYEREGNKKKVAELKKMRDSVLGATTDEELAVWARRIDPPQEARTQAAPVIVEAKPVEVPSAAVTAQGEAAVASTSQSVADHGTTEEGFVSLYDGGARATDIIENDDPQDTLGSAAPATSTPISAPVPEVGPARVVQTPKDYPRPVNTPLKWQAPPNPDLERDLAQPASLSDLEVLARQHGIPIEIFRQAYTEAKRQNVDYRLVLAVMKQESAFKPTAKSHAGARGLMQVMPATGRGLGVKDADLLYDIKTSIYAGTKYIRQMWSMFVDKGAAIVKSFDSGEVERVKKAIAAYNAGPGNVMKYNGVPRFKETQDYVVRVLGNYYGYMRDFPPAIS
ncbi:MAG: hypothetical protein COB53_12860 [Elusimicrobia bacterium]|nr:MAG: hypothetical protein COB53_12860 [Elusimicrobiota bacterium]